MLQCALTQVICFVGCPLMVWDKWQCVFLGLEGSNPARPGPNWVAGFPTSPDASLEIAGAGLGEGGKSGVPWLLICTPWGLWGPIWVNGESFTLLAYPDLPLETTG